MSVDEIVIKILDHIERTQGERFVDKVVKKHLVISKKAED